MCTVSRKNATVINFAQSHAQSLVLISFSCYVSEFPNTTHSQRISPWEVIRARFRDKCNNHKLCAKLRFDRFFGHRLGILKYWPFPTYWPMGSRTSTPHFDQFFVHHLRILKLTIPNVLSHGKRMSTVS
ncbi:hypothetical protein BHE74_00035723 [Ensete ventricosum]|nr:hypothetical protein GW17_00046016 [Ensete ventricosum]RWW57494.1 hypothetical protein BHE74_00035723 [Ensete ventricosum]RZR77469.1 hypothetical protein BHM03_00002557 [Ensete ventricosum]